ncbi:circularly permuted type 2 ATP-grasp protein [Pigmentiphaga soli]|uniref:Circularly permuted type 2 ATP-grasp protein n=1 Tax=Pigmentiphaga soli TaxID=1007095 RepID=A0ABP8GEP0_9BURK
MSDSLFPSESLLGAAGMAAHLALPAREGHYDELRERDPAGAGALRAPWQRFFDLLGSAGLADLDHRADMVARKIRENGVTYNIYAEADGPARPWSLDLLPFIVGESEWSAIESGLAQRAALLNRIAADVYGPQSLLAEGLVPPALVQGHPGYLRPLQGYRPPGGIYLHLVAFDLARAPDGSWWVVSQRTQAPSGLGYVLENRLTISHMFPEAFRDLRVLHLASSYRRLLDMLYRLSPAAAPESPRIVLLTPGPYNETYFEQTFLARYLGLTLVEGGDLTVRDRQLFLKTLHGLERVHGVLRRLDDDFCDPLELRADSTLGVPGLLQAVRAGNVLVANALGTSFLESPAINGFLPALARRLLGEELRLPSLATWWCGEEAARVQILPYLSNLVIKATYPAGRRQSSLEPVIGAYTSAAELEAARARIAADPDAHTLQAYLPLSQVPTWTGGRIVPRAAMVRVFAIADGRGGWSVLPGGMTRIGGRDQQVVSMQRGGSSLDTWVTTSGVVDLFTMLPEQMRPEDLSRRRRRPVSSRTAENLFWMGRYTERADNDTRLVRRVLERLSDEQDDGPPILAAVAALCERNGLFAAPAEAPATATAAFERRLLAELARADGESGIRYNLQAMIRAAGQIRDRLSPDLWRLILTAGEEFAGVLPREPGAEAEAPVLRLQAALQRLNTQLAAIAGAQADRMTRDDGWRLLTVGRQIERLWAMASGLHCLFADNAVLLESGFGLLLDVFDSSITYRASYQSRHEIPVLLNLLVFEATNPRALACVLDVLRSELARLPEVGGPAELLAMLPPSGLDASLAALCERGAEGRYDAVLALAGRMCELAGLLSNEISRRYFSHATDFDQALAA